MAESNTGNPRQNAAETNGSTGVTAEAPALYYYEAQTADGQVFRGALEGLSADQVQTRLGHLQLRVLSVEPAPDRPGFKSRRRLGADDFMLFNEQLAHLTSAGLPVERGLRLIAADMRRGRLARAAEDVARELENGVPLETAFSRHASRFPSLYGRLLEAGASVGNLPGMLFNLGRHLDLSSRLRESLWRTLSYPIMVLCALAAVLLFLSMVVLPQFELIFADFRVEMPKLTLAIFWLGSIFPKILLGIGILIAFVIVLSIILRLTGNDSLIRDSILIRVPVVGGVLRTGLLARWLDAIRLAIDAGLDLPRAIALAADATGARGRLASESADWARIIAEGQPPGVYQGSLIPSLVTTAVELSVNTGSLPETLLTLSRMFEQQAEQRRLRLLPTLITPILMLITGGSIAFCLTAMFLPLLRLIQSVSGGP